MTSQQPRDEKGRFASFDSQSADDNVFQSLRDEMRTAALRVLFPAESIVDGVTLHLIDGSTRRAASEINRIAPFIGTQVIIKKG